MFRARDGTADGRFSGLSYLLATSIPLGASHTGQAGLCISTWGRRPFGNLA